MDDKPIILTAEQARAGSTPHVVRYVLIISMTLSVLAMIAVAIWY
jgi:hypothetical protein